MGSASAVLGVAGLCLVVLLLPLHQPPCFCCRKPPRDLPLLCNGLPVREAPLIEVGPRQILLDGVTIDGVGAVEVERPAAVWPLVELLERKREIWQAFHPGKPVSAHLTLEIRRDVPAGLVKSVVASCVAAGFDELDFLGIRHCS